MHPDVVGVRVPAGVVAVGDHHLRTLVPHDAHEAADGLVEIGIGEVLGMGVRLGVGHAGVAVAEQVQRVVADDRHRVVELTHAHRGEVFAGLGRVGGRIEDVARLAPRAGDEHGVHALGVVAGDRGRALRRFVIGVRVHREHAQAC